MIRTLAATAALAALLALGACGPPAAPWYEQGNVSYDSLKSAADACDAKGGTFQLRRGGDPTYLGDYDCLTGKGKS